MRQFDVYENPVVSARPVMPHLVVLSSHLPPDLTEVIVAPLTSLRSVPISNLELAMSFKDSALVFITSDLAGISARGLNRRAGDLCDYEDDIRRALDRLFTGF